PTSAGALFSVTATDVTGRLATSFRVEVTAAATRGFDSVKQVPVVASNTATITVDMSPMLDDSLVHGAVNSTSAAAGAQTTLPSTALYLFAENTKASAFWEYNLLLRTESTLANATADLTIV